VSGWAVDLGTTNTGVARWDTDVGCPRWLTLDEICRDVAADDPLQASRLVPSATEVTAASGIIGRVSRNAWLARHAFLGRWAWIGRAALERNDVEPRAGFVSAWKHELAHSPLKTLARLGGRAISAREVATCFARELLAAIARTTGSRVRELVITTPVDAYESYRLELSNIFQGLGCRHVRFLDEPVAAALGYGVGAERTASVLVVDFGGGTLNLALVKLDARKLDASKRGSGVADVTAKVGVALGGLTVDCWVAAELCQRLGYDLSDESDRVWRELLLKEACRAKEAVYFDGAATFFAMLPEELRRFEARLQGEATSYELTRDGLAELLERHGLYRTLEACLGKIDEQSKVAGHPLESVNHVLMVGGSTLLPGVYPLFEKRFGRERVRAWQPFEAVAYGASAYAADRLTQSDFIVHDYAFVTHDANTHQPAYTTIVPAGTHFPTASDFWRRHLVPTCSLGQPETYFKLVICEIGQRGGPSFGWDDAGMPHDLRTEHAKPGPAYVVTLNGSNPTLGFLEPPHDPHDRAPRLEVAFGVDDERWLTTTVRDLKTGKTLLSGSPVVRLV
jgi:molecular chaperone DnaK (HSP70)